MECENCILISLQSLLRYKYLSAVQLELDIDDYRSSEQQKEKPLDIQYPISAAALVLAYQIHWVRDCVLFTQPAFLSHLGRIVYHENTLAQRNEPSFFLGFDRDEILKGFAKMGPFSAYLLIYLFCYDLKR